MGVQVLISLSDTQTSHCSIMSPKVPVCGHWELSSSQKTVEGVTKGHDSVTARSRRLNGTRNHSHTDH